MEVNTMMQKQFEKMRSGKGFIAALDQSGGSTPKALALYGITKDSYTTDEEMFDLVHQMRTRIITSPSFSSEHILGAILFEQTMDRKIEGVFTADYLWERKSIIPFLKVDKGLDQENEGVQLMKPIKDLDQLLKRAVGRNIFGTKMRSLILKANINGIKKIVSQQFDIAKKIIDAGLIPIIEPEVDIKSIDKKESEEILKSEILNHLQQLGKESHVMLKLSLPTVDDFYSEFIKHPRVLRVVALSGGYTREEANEKLARNHGLIASFSRALTEGLNVKQSDKEFDDFLRASVESIYKASIV